MDRAAGALVAPVALAVQAAWVRVAWVRVARVGAGVVGADTVMVAVCESTEPAGFDMRTQ